MVYGELEAMTGIMEYYAIERLEANYVCIYWKVKIMGNSSWAGFVLQHFPHLPCLINE